MLEWRSGATGAGVFAGCGVGVVAPVSLHGIPVLGQVASGLSQAAATVDAGLGGISGRAARAAAGLGGRMGVRNFSAGAGCGVMLGYGWGWGLMVKPTALQHCQAALQSAVEQLVARLPPPARAAVKRQVAAAAASSWPQGQLSMGLLPPAGDPTLDSVGPSAASRHDASRLVAQQAARHPPRQQQQEEEQQQRPESWERQQREIDTMAKLLVSQQNEINSLRQEVRELQRALAASRGSTEAVRQR